MRFVNVMSAKNLKGEMRNWSQTDIEAVIKNKEILSNYINSLNIFYNQLFSLPSTLK